MLIHSMAMNLLSLRFVCLVSANTFGSFACPIHSVILLLILSQGLLRVCFQAGQLFGVCLSTCIPVSKRLADGISLPNSVERRLNSTGLDVAGHLRFLAAAG